VSIDYTINANTLLSLFVLDGKTVLKRFHHSWFPFTLDAVKHALSTLERLLACASSSIMCLQFLEFSHIKLKNCKAYVA
jgi:hypothetical protein